MENFQVSYSLKVVLAFQMLTINFLPEILSDFNFDVKIYLRKFCEEGKKFYQNPPRHSRVNKKVL